MGGAETLALGLARRKALARKCQNRRQMGFLPSIGTDFGCDIWCNTDPCGLICGGITWFLVCFAQYTTMVRGSKLLLALLFVVHCACLLAPSPCMRSDEHWWCLP